MAFDMTTGKGCAQSIVSQNIAGADMDIQNIPDEKLCSMTKNILIGHGVINVPISQRAGKTYYFNEDEIYSIDKNSSRFPYKKQMKFYVYIPWGKTYFNMNVWNKAVSRFEVGMSLDECIRIFMTTKLEHRAPQELSPADKLIQYISPPLYERDPENTDEATFDRIRMTVGLPRYHFDSWEALQSEVKKYQDEMSQRVIRKLDKDWQFRKYDFPINSLLLTAVHLLRDYSVEFIFELKDLKTDPTQGKQNCPFP